MTSTCPGESPVGPGTPSAPGPDVDPKPVPDPSAVPVHGAASEADSLPVRRRHIAAKDQAPAPLTITVPRFWTPLTRFWAGGPDGSGGLPKPVQRAGLGMALLAVVATAVAGATGHLTGTVLARDRGDATSSSAVTGPPAEPDIPAAVDPAANPPGTYAPGQAALAASAPQASPVLPGQQALPGQQGLPGQLALPGQLGTPGQPGAPVPLPAAAPPGQLPVTPTPGQSGATKQLSTSGMPARAKAAYTAAENRMATLAPTCRIPWTLLAAIGRVESDHARHNGAKLIASSGRAFPGVYGVRLDGTTPGTAVVRDTDRGTLDADTSFDRAVGPMQFLPGTWRTFGVDADGDRAANPQDLDDAALTAARFLCTGATTDLSSTTGQWNAAYRYNHAVSYANLVVALSTTYATGKPATVVNPPQGASTVAPTVTLTVTPAPPVVTATSTPPTVPAGANLPTAPSVSTVTITSTQGNTQPGSEVSVVTVTVSYTTVTVTDPGKNARPTRVTRTTSTTVTDGEHDGHD
ncbi:MAG: hypothetical protein QG622_1134 [Actinomycetota bacterium]|nr:hypothetical protein [Actinomycetota bacterium]